MADERSERVSEVLGRLYHMHVGHRRMEGPRTKYEKEVVNEKQTCQPFWNERRLTTDQKCEQRSLLRTAVPDLMRYW